MNAASDEASTSARIATVATPRASVLTEATRENIAVVAVAANVAPIVSASKRTERLARGAPLLSLSVTDAVADSPEHNVAAEIAALLDKAQADPDAGTIATNPAVIVAGVTVTVTTEVAEALSVMVSVTGVFTATLAGVNVNDAPVIAAVTGNTVALPDDTLNGPTPPVMPTVFGVLPKATKVVGVALRVLDVAGVDELEPPQPESPSMTVATIAPSASLPFKV